MATNANMADALNAKFYSVMSGMGAAPPRSYISFINGGYAYSNSDLAFIKDPQNNLGALRLFSAQVNAIPTSVGWWAPTASQMSDAYSAWLKVAQVPSVKLTTEEQKALDDANKYLKENYKNYKKYQTKYDNLTTSLSALMQEDPRPKDYMKRLSELTKSRNNALTDWNVEGQKNEVENQIAIQQHLSGIGYHGIITDLQNRYTQTESLYLDPITGQNFVPTFITPAGFLDNQWNTFTFTSNEVSKYVNNSKTQWGGSVSGAYSLFWGSAEASGSSERSTYQLNGTDISISFEYARVSLDRTSWFSSFLLQSRAWWYQGATKKDPTFGGMTFSDGTIGASNPGQWQMIPTDVFWVRNLKVKFDTTNEENQKTLDTLETKASAGFWIFKVSGSYSSTNSTETYKFKRTSDGIECPTMQMTAFLCQLLPKEPNPEPSLLPDSLEVVLRNHLTKALKGAAASNGEPTKEVTSHNIIYTTN